jgi:hypothetical protein
MIEKDGFNWQTKGPPSSVSLWSSALGLSAVINSPRSERKEMLLAGPPGVRVKFALRICGKFHKFPFRSI